MAFYPPVLFPFGAFEEMLMPPTSSMAGLYQQQQPSRPPKNAQEWFDAQQGIQAPKKHHHESSSSSKSSTHSESSKTSSQQLNINSSVFVPKLNVKISNSKSKSKHKEAKSAKVTDSVPQKSSEETKPSHSLNERNRQTDSNKTKENSNKDLPVKSSETKQQSIEEKKEKDVETIEKKEETSNEVSSTTLKLVDRIFVPKMNIANIPHRSHGSHSKKEKKESSSNSQIKKLPEKSTSYLIFEASHPGSKPKATPVPFYKRNKKDTKKIEQDLSKEVCGEEMPKDSELLKNQEMQSSNFINSQTSANEKCSPHSDAISPEHIQTGVSSECAEGIESVTEISTKSFTPQDSSTSSSTHTPSVSSLLQPQTQSPSYTNSEPSAPLSPHSGTSSAPNHADNQPSPSSFARAPVLISQQPEHVSPTGGNLSAACPMPAKPVVLSIPPSPGASPLLPTPAPFASRLSNTAAPPNSSAPLLPSFQLHQAQNQSAVQSGKAKATYSSSSSAAAAAIGGGGGGSLSSSAALLPSPESQGLLPAAVPYAHQPPLQPLGSQAYLSHPTGPALAALAKTNTQAAMLPTPQMAFFESSGELFQTAQTAPILSGAPLKEPAQLLHSRSVNSPQQQISPLSSHSLSSSTSPHPAHSAISLQQPHAAHLIHPGSVPLTDFPSLPNSKNKQKEKQATASAQSSSHSAVSNESNKKKQQKNKSQKDKKKQNKQKGKQQKDK
ncbi:uncharacterized protein MONOS_4107 [Monocercomonoides exilis]|uniref:uncharacterized protein n=1 Tax=Monocercomonoides exilis TaxID=2049356 RepID=UPI003559876B|nr:hypothetical protein MONOS_4107 [Monocercomonoides exilis]|eukprot:MONOS_4107.1-p1 / transcript=MONOS_4107.1 / gene=MONOS_4107 / organism=Monocercomonoides_exilis_PA203 / gene_product=unspecified product / transcript_product=unspecified product / location=Mono_scaffold00104:119168-121388(+) / protein_length=723 / sequence_SO=supercontig / SO=protein_coding / is_pseudo=false